MGQLEGTPLGQRILRQPDGGPAQAGRRLAAILHQRQRALRRLLTQKEVQQTQQIRFKARNNLHDDSVAKSLFLVR